MFTQKASRTFWSFRIWIGLRGRTQDLPQPHTAVPEMFGTAIDHCQIGKPLRGDLHPCPKQDVSDPGMVCSNASSRSLSVVEIGRPSGHPSTPSKEDSACRTP